MNYSIRKIINKDHANNRATAILLVHAADLISCIITREQNTNICTLVSTLDYN